MAKYYGKIGFVETKENETSPGDWEEEVIAERACYGEEQRIARKWQTTSHLNDDVGVSIELSIIADPDVMSAFDRIRYVTWRGNKWKISNVRLEFPRLILSIGGVYNG